MIKPEDIWGPPPEPPRRPEPPPAQDAPVWRGPTADELREMRRELLLLEAEADAAAQRRSEEEQGIRVRLTRLGLSRAVESTRRRKGLTQAAVARRARVGIGVVHDLEHAATDIRLGKLLAVLHVLGLELRLEPEPTQIEKLSRARRAPAP